MIFKKLIQLLTVWISVFSMKCVANVQNCFLPLKYVPSLGDTSPGSVWPQPQSLISTEQIFTIAVDVFEFSYVPSSYQCNILEEAFKRYKAIMMKSFLNRKLHFSNSSSPSILKNLKINLMSPCETYPYLEMDESYDLDVGNLNMIVSHSVWGVLRGLESFSQLMWMYDGQVIVNSSNIIDFPRFSHRGILLDTSRHYLPLNVILKNLDAMSYNKLNVFHWHIVDEQSFPYVSQVFPDLSEKGAYNPFTYIYTPEDVTTVIEYARLRGIRVVPEFDTPGHTLSWGKGYPYLLTPCYNGEKPNGEYGPFNPILDTTYSFVDRLFTELRNVFPEKYIHLGGDEVSYVCWMSNPEITQYMKEHNFSSQYAKLEEVYIQKILNITDYIGFSSIVWQEVFDNGVQIKHDTVVEVWKNKENPGLELSLVTAAGFRAIISSPWYLNKIAYGEDWIKFYNYQPDDFNGTAQQKSLVIGGEACMWGEYVDGTNLIPRLWPRASAVAERLWSAKSVDNTTMATPRLHQHRCKMIQRGIPAEPLHPGFCIRDWKNYL